MGAASNQQHEANYQQQGDNSGEIEHGGDYFWPIHKSLEAMKAAIKQNIPYPVPIRIPAGENDSKEMVGIMNEAPNQAMAKPEKNSDSIFNWPGVMPFFTGNNFTPGGGLAQGGKTGENISAAGGGTRAETGLVLAPAEVPQGNNDGNDYQRSGDTSGIQIEFHDFSSNKNADTINDRPILTKAYNFVKAVLSSINAATNQATAIKKKRAVKTSRKVKSPKTK